MSDTAADQKLIKAYLSGQKEAVAEVDRFIGSAFSVWRRRLATDEDDIRSDVHLKLLNAFRRGDFRFEAGPNTYISSIVSHTCTDYLRLNARTVDAGEGEMEPQDSTRNAEENLEAKQLARINFRVIRLISGECLQLWKMYLKMGLSYRQIGEIMGKSEGNIRRRFWACREAAKEIREKILKQDKHLDASDACKSDERKS